MTLLDEVSLFDADPRALEDPYRIYEAARAIGPIVREPHHGVLLVTRYEDIVEISNRHHDFSATVSAYGPWATDVLPARPEQCPFGTADLTEDLVLWNAHTAFGSIPVVSMDPPRHTAFRSLVNRLFTPARQKEIEPKLAEMAAELIDEFVAAGSVEFVAAFAAPYPFFVINEVFGIPEEDRKVLRTLYRSRSTPAAADPGASLAAMRDVVRGEGEAAVAAMAAPPDELDRLFVEFIRDRRGAPRGDILTEIATARFPDGTLPELEELLHVSKVVYGAGHNTTSHLLTNAMYLLATQSELQRSLRGEPDRIIHFVDEVLRFAPPVQGLFRYAKRDVEIDGVEIPAGSVLWLLYAAANRDPERFGCPAAFEVDRANSRQALTFGHGVHFCPGQPLARLESRIAFTELLRRLDDIRLDGDLEPRYPFWFVLRGPESLPLRFSPLR